MTSDISFKKRRKRPELPNKTAGRVTMTQRAILALYNESLKKNDIVS